VLKVAYWYGIDYWDFHEEYSVFSIWYCMSLSQWKLRRGPITCYQPLPHMKFNVLAGPRMHKLQLSFLQLSILLSVKMYTALQFLKLQLMPCLKLEICPPNTPKPHYYHSLDTQCAVYCIWRAASFFNREVPHVTLLLVWTHKRNDVSLKINIISTLMRQSYPSSMVSPAFKMWHVGVVPSLVNILGYSFRLKISD
jgi:hypothetical protein